MRREWSLRMRRRGDKHHGETGTRQRSLKSLLWTLITLVAVIFMLLAMWGHYGENKSSTVNPTKTPVRN
jgi:hypothetical protein